MSFSIRAVPKLCCLIAVIFCMPAISIAASPPLVIEPESESSGFSTNTFIPDFLGPGFVTVGRGSSFDFEFEITIVKNTELFK